MIVQMIMRKCIQMNPRKNPKILSPTLLIILSSGKPENGSFFPSFTDAQYTVTSRQTNKINTKYFPRILNHQYFVLNFPHNLYTITTICLKTSNIGANRYIKIYIPTHCTVACGAARVKMLQYVFGVLPIPTYQCTEVGDDSSHFLGHLHY